MRHAAGLAGTRTTGCMPLLATYFIRARIDDQRQCSFVYGLPRSAFRIAKTTEAVCVQNAVSEWPMAARRRFRRRHHGACLTRSARRATSSRACRIGAAWTWLAGRGGVRADEPALRAGVRSAQACGSGPVRRA